MKNFHTEIGFLKTTIIDERCVWGSKYGISLKKYRSWDVKNFKPIDLVKTLVLSLMLAKRYLEKAIGIENIYLIFIDV